MQTASTAGIPLNQETYDDWRIERISRSCVQTVGDVVIEGWTFNYELHVVDPENVVLAFSIAIPGTAVPAIHDRAGGHCQFFQLGPIKYVRVSCCPCLCGE